MSVGIVPMGHHHRDSGTHRIPLNPGHMPNANTVEVRDGIERPRREDTGRYGEIPGAAAARGGRGGGIRLGHGGHHSLRRSERPMTSPRRVNP